MPGQDFRSPGRPTAARAARMLGVVILAMMAGAGPRRGPGPRPPRPPRPRKPGPPRGGYPMPHPVRPDRPGTLTGGAAAELSFDD